MDRLIDLKEFQEFRQTKIHSLIGLLWTDDQISCISENIFIFGFAIASKIKYFRNKILDGDYVYVLKTGDYYFLAFKEKDAKGFRIAGTNANTVIAKKIGFFQMWDDIPLPEHIVEFIEKSKNIKEMKRKLHKIMGLKAFW